MNDKTLRLFRTVAECGSFSRAEALSFISKQAIVKQVDALETELGAKLFTRSSRGVRLTEAGEILYRGQRSCWTFRKRSWRTAAGALGKRIRCASAMSSTRLCSAR